MYKITKIKANNFKCFQSISYNVIQDDVSMIFGKNRNSEGANSNGAGKSSFMQIISIGLIGLSKSLPKEEYILNGEKQGSVAIFLQNELTREEIIVKRSFFRSKSKPTKASIFINGVEDKNVISETELNKTLEQKLLLTKADLTEYFIISQQNDLGFLSSSDTKQKEILSRLAKLNGIDKLLDEIKSKISSLNTKKSEIELTIARFQAKIEIHNENLQNLRKKAAQAGELDLTEQIESIQIEIQDLQRQLIPLESYYSKLQETLQGQEKIRDKQESIQRKLRALKRQKIDIENKLLGAVCCPECNAQFLLGQESISELELKLQLVIGEIESESANLNDQIEDQIFITEKEIRINKKSISSLREEIFVKTKRLNNLNNEHEMNFKVPEMELNEKIQNLCSSVTTLEDEKINLLFEIDQNNFWLINLGQKGFKTFLINKILTQIQDGVNFFLSKITQIQVRLDGYKVLANGEVRERINLEVSKDSQTWEPYLKFSGGQRNRIDLCALLCIRKIINNNAILNGGGLNFLGLDETFDGLDQIGQKFVIDMLSNLGETVLIVSHGSENIAVKNKIIVASDGQISELL